MPMTEVWNIAIRIASYFFGLHSAHNIHMELAFPAREGKATALFFAGSTVNPRMAILEGELMERMEEVFVLSG